MFNLACQKCKQPVPAINHPPSTLYTAKCEACGGTMTVTEEQMTSVYGQSIYGESTYQ